MIGPFKGEYDWASNFYEFARPIVRPVFLNGKWIEKPFYHSEGPYQILKCKDPNSHQFFFQDGDCKSPKECKDMGSKVFLREDWDEVRVDIMRQLLRDKFWNNPDLAERLLATMPVPLCEINWWHDNFWGNCMGKDMKGCFKDECQRPGLNWLGQLLVEIRNELYFTRLRLPADQEVQYVFRQT